MHKILSTWWIALSIATILMVPYISAFTDEVNRHQFYFTRTDIFAILCTLLLESFFITVFILIGNRLINDSKIRNRVYLSTLLVAISPHIINFSIFKFLKEMPYSWKILNSDSLPIIYMLQKPIIYGIFIGALCLIVFKGDQFKKFIVGGLQVFSPLIILLIIKFMSFTSVPLTLGEVPVGNKMNDSKFPNVYLFIFDSWSYKRSYENKKPIDILPNLNKFSQSSMSYHQVESIGSQTVESIDRLVWEYSDKKKDIFSIGKENGWKSILLGTSIPYSHLFGNSADYIWTTSYIKPHSSFFELILFYFNWGTLKPYFDQIFDSEDRYVRLEQDYKQIRWAHIKEKTIDLLSQDIDKTFFYFHYLMPHPPYMKYPDEFEKNISEEELKIRQYRGNLVVMDQLISKIMETLKMAGKWESSIVILATDHSWTNDPVDYKKHLMHVPLLVKLPYQNKSMDIYEPFKMSQIKTNIVNLLKQKDEYSAKELQWNP